MRIRLDGWAHGGEAVGRLPDGRACFVAGGIPGELVEVELTNDRKRWARARLVEVVEPAADRIDPPCPHAARCGGCQLQHVTPLAQTRMKSQVLTEQLQRIGRQRDLPAVQVLTPDDAWPARYRLRARVAVAPDGALGFRRRGSHQVEPVEHCMLLTDGAQRLMEDARGTVSGPAELSLLAGDDDGIVTRADDEAAGAPMSEQPREAVTVTVGRHSFSVGAGSFFQASRGGALLLAETVRDAAAVGPGDQVADLYCGVGLLTVFLAETGAHVTAVEGDPSAVADCRRNTDGMQVRVLAGDVREAVSGLAPQDVIVLDPPRSGAGRELCESLVAARPRRIIYVACDPAALARDTATITDDGYALTSVVGLDLFGYTAHIEAVATFEPMPDEGAA